MQADVLLCLLVPQPTDTTAPQPATVLYTNPQDSISILTRHFSGIHFNIILQCMRISSKLHITLRCSGQNVRDFQFFNFVKLSFPFLFTFAHQLQRYVLKFFPSDSSHVSQPHYKWTLTPCCEMNKTVFLHQGHSAVRTTCCTAAAFRQTSRATEQQYAVWRQPVSRHAEMPSGQSVRTERWTQCSVTLLNPL